ncbi:MAG: ATP-grasp domain-containing protein [Chloroherpetonaceae bacterium]|nr:ATP-grasp domain-containing protein [Chloroherpetonaceae bacterium]
MKHILVIYNAVPDRSSLSRDLKSEMGLMEVAAGIVGSLEPQFHVSSIPFIGDIVLLMEQLRDLKPDAVFNLFEGTYGISQSEVLVPVALEIMRIPYTGSRPKTLELCVNKARTKEVLLRRNVPTPRFDLFLIGENIHTSLQFPLMVKPAHEDASIGIANESVVESEEQLKARVAFIWNQHKQAAIAEEFIDGREFNVSICGDPDFEHDFAHPSQPRVLPISEIKFDSMPTGLRRIVSYKAKWDEASVEYQSTVPQCPASLDSKLEGEIKLLAMRTFEAVGCRDYARVDFRLSREGKPYVIDVNPNPDISPDAGLARAFKVSGKSYDEMIRFIAGLALNRKALPGSVF